MDDNKAQLLANKRKELKQAEWLSQISYKAQDGLEAALSLDLATRQQWQTAYDAHMANMKDIERLRSELRELEKERPYSDKFSVEKGLPRTGSVLIRVLNQSTCDDGEPNPIGWYTPRDEAITFAVDILKCCGVEIPDYLESEDE